MRRRAPSGVSAGHPQTSSTRTAGCTEPSPSASRRGNPGTMWLAGSCPPRLVPPRVLAAGLDEADAPRWRPLARGAGLNSAPQSGPTPAPHEAGTFEAVGISRSAGAPDIWSSTSRADLLFAFTVNAFDELPR